MTEPSAGQPVAVLAGGGALPPLVAAAAAAHGRVPVVFAIAGEAEPASFAAGPVHAIRWGEVGRLFRLIDESGCREAVFVGSIARRPDFAAMRPDLGAVKLLPRILQLLRGGDDSVLKAVAAILEERGVKLVSPLALAPALVLPSGLAAGKASPEANDEIAKAAEAARLIGRLDIGQAAVAVGRRVVAVEDAGGTDALLERVAALRRGGRIAKAGGVLVKCMKPQQDPRLDVPTIGPATAEAALRAGLHGVAGEAGRTLLAGRDETLEAFRRAGLFLFGIPGADGRDA
jgi:DUF1009 family protein